MTHSTESSQLKDLNLEQELATPAGKRRYVRTLFDTVERSYDGFTRLFSAGMDGAWKRRMVALLAEHGLTEGRALDLATGTGDIVALLRARLPAVEVTGADLSHQMLQRARQRANPPGCSNAVADMNELPYASGSLTAITAGYAFRNAPGFRECHITIRRVAEGISRRDCGQ